MKQEGDYTILSSGRRFYTFDGRLHPEPHGQLTYGSDGNVDVRADTDKEDDVAAPPFTEEERREIAMEMITRWALWAAT